MLLINFAQITLLQNTLKVYLLLFVLFQVNVYENIYS